MPYIIKEGETGELIDDDNVETASQKLYNLLTDSRYKQNVKQRQHYFINEYSWDKVAERINKVIG